MRIPRANTILGQTGTGKSRLLQCLLSLSTPQRLIIADTMAEHERLAEHVSLRALHEMRNDATFAASVIPTSEDELDWICDLAASVVNSTLVIDEYAAWWSVAQRQPSRGLLLIARAGRKLRQGLFVTTQSPNTINKGVVSQTAVWAFPMTEPRDRQYVVDVTRGGLDPADLKVLESGGPEEIFKTEVACYEKGYIRRFCLDNRLPSLEEIV